MPNDNATAQPRAPNAGSPLVEHIKLVSNAFGLLLCDFADSIRRKDANGMRLIVELIRRAADSLDELTAQKQKEWAKHPGTQTQTTKGNT
jgi:hypothetical protein